MRKLYCATFIIILFAACSGTKFTVANFGTKTVNHKQIAILPFEIVYTGKTPKKMEATDIEKVRYAEALAFQKSMYNNILSQSGQGKKEIKIEVQQIEKTNKLLKDGSIQYLALKTITSEKLCKILGVDAVVFTRVEKERFLSDLKPFGVSITQDVLDKLHWGKTDLNNNLPQIPGNAVRTYSIKTHCELKSGANGELLWKNTMDIDTEWKSTANEVIPQLTRRYSKNFPYRNR